LSEAENHRNRADFFDACAVLTATLYERQEEVIASTPTPPDWLTGLVAEWDRRRTAVITLNYDTLVEKAFVQQAQNPKRHHSILYPVPPTNINLRNAAIYAISREPTFSLLKLHGSVNWRYSGAPTYYGETIYDIPMAGAGWVGGDTREYFVEKARDKQPLVVPPTATKTSLFDNETVRANWRDAAEALARAERVFCLGYSLPTADLSMRYLVSQVAASLTVIPADTNLKAAAHYAELLPHGCTVVSRFCMRKDPIPSVVKAWLQGSV
jgi:hypothetical protein